MTSMQIYSAALIIVGVSFKMLLTEYKYEKEEVANITYSSSYRSDRFLAEISEEESVNSVEPRRKRIAVFFCVGLGLTFLFLDLMTMAHRGLNATMARFFGAEKESNKIAGITFIFVRVLVVLFISTAFLYVKEPEIVALVGLIAILLQLFIRIAVFFFFPYKEEEAKQSNDAQQSNDKDVKFEVNPTEANEVQSSTIKYDLHNGGLSHDHRKESISYHSGESANFDGESISNESSVGLPNL